MEAHGSWSHHYWLRKKIPHPSRGHTIKFDVCIPDRLLNLEFMSYQDDSNSTYHDSISTMLLYTQSRERPDIQSSRVWKHSALVLMPAENRLHCSERGRWLGWSVAGEISRQQNTYAALQHIYLQPEDLRKLSLMARTLQCSCQAAGNYHLKVPFSLIPQQFFKRGALQNKC